MKKKTIDILAIILMAVFISYLFLNYTYFKGYKSRSQDVCQSVGLDRFSSCDGKDLCGYGQLENKILCSGNDSDYYVNLEIGEKETFFRR